MSERPMMKIFSGTANRKLAADIAGHLGAPLGALKITRFPDGEMYVKFEESVRGADVFIVQPTCAPIDQNLFELLVVIDALKRASADRVTCVIPYFGYAGSRRSTRRASRSRRNWSRI